MPVSEVLIPDVFLELFQPHRYKVMYSGRGCAKSWTVARVLLVRAAQEKLRILCAREIQNSIQESVHSLLTQQISLLGLQDFFEIQKTTIIGKNGSEFIFSGLKHKIDSLKSLEGCNICWVEEANIVSKSSWEKLLPTIRAKDSEIWITFNPELKEDYVYDRFVLNPPENAWVQRITYKDNPWFGDELREEMRQTRARSEDDYRHIWLGYTKEILEGAVYGKQMSDAMQEGRITKVPYDKQYPVTTAWDFGHHDLTAIWMIQKIGFQYNVIDYHEDRLQELPYYVNVLQTKGYNYGTDIMPHDAESHQGLGSTIKERFVELTGRRPIIVPRDSIANGVDAVRTLFPKLYFDEAKCADGLTALRRYAYEVDEKTGEFSRIPEHNRYSHGADAMRYFAVSTMRTPRDKPVLDLQKKRPTLNIIAGSRNQKQAWMGRR